MYAKKSLGQHFLRSTRALNAIIEAGSVNENDVVLEIGPGEGALTKRLLDAGASVLAVEKDDNLFQMLKSKFSKEIRIGKLILRHEDILDFSFATPIAPQYKLIANIPYNITGAILKKFLSAEHQPTQMVLLVQDEVAKRIVAGCLPAGRQGKESILSLSVKAYGTPRYVEKVLAGSFAPAPKVNSAIISIEGISKEFFANFSEEHFFKLVNLGFRSKRKKLSSNLSLIVDREKVREAFSKLDLNENTRAEDLNIEMWGKLVSLLN